MAVRIGSNKWNAGDYFYAEDFNDTFQYGATLLQIITPSNLNISVSSQSGTFTTSEIFSITPSFGLISFDTLLFVIHYKSHLNYGFEKRTSHYITLQTRPMGGVFTDSLPETEVYYLQTSSNGGVGNTVNEIYVHTHELTNDEKNDNVEINIEIKVYNENDPSTTFEIKKILVYGVTL